MPKFFLNYGGPGGFWLTESRERAAKLNEACHQEYFGAKSAIAANIQGVQVVVYTYGIHRCVSCEIPDGPNIPPGADLASRRQLEQNYIELRRRYDNLLLEARIYSNQGYNLFNHNCVTGTAHVLHALDPHLAPEGMVSPWSLDSELDKYCGDYSQASTLQRFFDEYQTKMRSGVFSFMHITTWSKGMDADDKTTLDDIIKHSYGRGVEGSGERTKSTLIDLGWVRQGPKGILVPTDKAPQDFREGLTKYNADFEKVERLKALYIENASVFSFNKHHFFDDNPDFKTAKARLEAQVARNPHGASAKALELFSKEEAIRVQKENAQVPRSLDSFRAVLMAERESQGFTPEFPPPAITPLLDDAAPTVSHNRFKEAMQTGRASQSPLLLADDTPGPDEGLTRGLSF